jgi:flagellar hook assembly protein FlgD
MVTKLIGNYPNPFNPTTTISFQINNQQNEQVELSIYNLKGQRVKTLPVILSGNEVQSSVIWNGTDDNNQPVSSGVYLYKLQAGEFSQTKKMMLMK